MKLINLNEAFEKKFGIIDESRYYSIDSSIDDNVYDDVYLDKAPSISVDRMDVDDIMDDPYAYTSFSGGTKNYENDYKTSQQDRDNAKRYRENGKEIKAALGDDYPEYHAINKEISALQGRIFEIHSELNDIRKEMRFADGEDSVLVDQMQALNDELKEIRNKKHELAMKAYKMRQKVKNEDLREEDIINNKYFNYTYVNDEFLRGFFEECIEEAANSGNFTPSIDPVMYDDNGDPGYPGENANIEDYSPDYYEAYDKAFKLWLDTINSDDKIPAELKDFIKHSSGIEYMQDLFDDVVNPMTENMYIDAVINKANELYNR